MGSDHHDLKRFLDAQTPVVERVTRELAAGRKESHWMWFVFPQLRGLGHSPTAEYYGIASIAEARAYLAHPVLGPRLEMWTRTVLDVEGRSAEEIFGYPDYLKFRSSMTLFDAADPARQEFRQALVKYYEGSPDEATLSLLQG